MKISLQDFGLDVEKAPLDALYSDVGRNYLLNSGDKVDFEEQDVIPTTVGEYLPTDGGRNLIGKFNTVEGGWVNGSGEFSNWIYGVRSLFIKVDPFTKLTFKHSGFDEPANVVKYGLALYDIEKNIIERLVVTRTNYKDVHTFEVTENTHYVVAFWEDTDPTFSEPTKLEKGDIATPWTPAPEDFNNLKGKSYALSQPLQNENILFLNGSFEKNDFIGLLLGDDKFVGFLDNGELTFDLTENYDDEFVVIKTLSEKGVIDNAKLEKGSAATPWSPAWEDLPSEDKPVEYATFENEVTYQNNGYFKGTFMGNGTVNGIDVSKKTVIETYDDIVITGTEIYAYNMTQEPLSMKHILLEFGHRLEKIAVVGNDDISDIVKEYKISMNSDLWRTGMKEATLKLDGRHSFEDFKDGVDLSLKGTYENLTKTHEFGRFYLIDKDMLEYNDVTQETTLTLYDSMIKAHQEFLASDIGVSFPTTIKNVVDGIAGYMGLVVNTSYPNSGHVIEENKWENNGLTYRDALDDIAVMANAVIGIFENKLQIKEITSAVIETINRGETSLKHESKWGKPNVLNLTREPQHDNYAYPLDWHTIPKDERIEIVFENNQIIDKRREELAPTIFNQVNEIEYTPFEYKGFGYLTMDYGDYVGFTDRDNNIQYSYVTQLEWHVTNGFTEMLGSELTSKAKEEYVLNTDQRKLGMQTYFLVDQQNGIIQGLVNDINDQEERISEFLIDLEQINAKVEGVNFGSILINGAGEEFSYDFWKANVTNDVLVPFVNLYPLKGITTYTIFEPLEDTDTLSGTKLSFFANGQMLNGLFPVLRDYKYSYRVRRVNGHQNFTVEIHEFDGDEVYLRKQVFNFNENKLYEEFSNVEMGENTEYIGLNYVISGVDVSNRLELAETMYGIGAPKAYAPNVDGIKAWTQSQLNIQNDKIESTVSSIQIIDGKVVQNSSSITQLANQISLKADKIDLQGLVSISDLSGNKTTTIDGSNIRTGKILSQYIEFDNATGVNVNLTGKITATTGKIGGYTISGNDLVGNLVSLRPSQIDIGQSILKNPSDTTILRIETFRLDLQPTSNWLSVGMGSLNSVLLYNNNNQIVTANLTNLNVTGSKQAIVPTRDGIRGIHAYETPTAHFGDIYEVYVEDTLYVEIEELFSDTIHLEDYHVFTTTYENGNVWVENRTPKGFEIHVSKPMNISYEIKGVRRGFRDKRLPLIDIDYKEYAKVDGYEEQS